MRKGIIYVYFNRAKYEKEGIEKYYVGQTIGTMEQRAGKNGRNYGWDDSNCNNKFANSIRKWGWNAFESKVLEEVYEEDLNELEKFYIEQFNSYENGYNSTIGGEGIRGYNHNKESKKKMSIAGKKRFESQEARKRQSEAVKKHYEDPKEREKLGKKMSIVSKKRFQDPKERENISITIKKHYKDPKERKKMSIANKKRLEDQKIREKIREKLLGEKSYKAKSVYCKELNIVFSYVKLAEKYCTNILNIKIGPISGACNGKRKSTGKYNGEKLTWKYKEDVDQENLDKAEYIDSKKYEEILSQNVNDCK